LARRQVIANQQERTMSTPIPDDSSSQPEATSAGRLSNGQFAKGNPGGPGRPRSAVSAAAAALDQAAVDAHQELMQVVLDQARAGNLKATEMLWARIWPLRRGRPMAFDMLPVAEKSDVLPAKTTVAEAVLSGEITTHEATPLLELIDAQFKAVQDESFDRRWKAIKAELGLSNDDDEE
jgi:hypothetical protein